MAASETAARAARGHREEHPAAAGRSGEAPAVRPAWAARHRTARSGAAGPSSVWWARTAEQGPGSVEHSLLAVNSERFPDGTPVDLTALESRGRRPAGWLVDVRFRASDGAVRHVEVCDALAELCPPLWFTEVAHAMSDLPATSLVAFRGGAFPAGSVVAPHQVAARGVRMGDRVGELRWWTRSGLVDTVTVVPAVRRRGVGRVLVTVAEALRMLRGWAPLRADGRLTDLGAAWVAGAPPYWRPRLAERTCTLPPDDGSRGPTGVAALLR